LPSQSPKPGAQLGAQTPLIHAAEPFGLAQATMQEPQCCELVLVFVSQPFVGSPSQLENPGLHVGMQRPPMHAVVPFGLTQATPQAPQFCKLLSRSASQPSSVAPGAGPLQFAKPGAH
jgi:hypothetical protein